MPASHNIRWYLPQQYADKLLPVFTQIAEWKHGEQAKTSAHFASGDHRNQAEMAPVDVGENPS
jgi:hypothetical protein